MNYRFISSALRNRPPIDNYPGPPDRKAGAPEPLGGQS
jgi:hypothetical protein